MGTMNAQARLGAWQSLQAEADTCKTSLSLARALKEASRFEQLSLQAPHIFLDCSKCLWDTASFQALLSLAEQAGVAERRNALYGGAIVNETEQRPALHVRLRSASALNAGQVEPETCWPWQRACVRQPALKMWCISA